MKKVALAAISAALSLGTLGVAAPAQAAPGKEIRVAGSTQWRETYTVIRELKRKWGIPISDNLCRPGEQYCITIRHINSPTGWAGFAEGSTGNATVTLNSYYGNSSSYRKAVLYHEFGHALGLWEHSGCGSSMSSSIAQCGPFVFGYNAAEQQKLRGLWG